MHKDELLDPLEGYSSLKGLALWEFLEGPCSEDHLDDPVYKRMTDKKAIEIICRMSGCSHVQEISGLPEQQQEKLIREARKAAVSIRQLSRLTGISKTKIERIAKEKNGLKTSKLSLCLPPEKPSPPFPTGSDDSRGNAGRRLLFYLI